MKIIVGADPFAYELKRAVATHLSSKAIEIIDADNYAEIPYFDVALDAAKQVAEGKADGAILFCGTGAGMNIVANKVKGIRAVSVESVFSAKKAKAINNANIIAMGAMIVGNFMACEMVDAWLETKFAEGFEPLKEFLTSATNSVANIDSETRA